MKYSGTISRGVRTPIIKRGDDLASIVVDSLCKCVEEAKIELHDRDVVAITEAVVGISQGNYATADQIAEDVRSKFGDDTVGILFPIMSRNRFSMLLRGITRGLKKVVIQFSYPGDEVGNKLIPVEELFDSGVNPYSDRFTLAAFKKIFPNTVHEFTGVDYPAFYQSISECECEVILANDPRAILEYTDSVIVASIHDRKLNKARLLAAGAKKVLCLDELMTAPVNGSGYNDKYGLLGSNLATDDSVKLFPIRCDELVADIHARLEAIFHKNIEVMVYGDGAFKDPKGGIWELADPVVSPAYTAGLVGTPNELKLKYISDNALRDLHGDELRDEMIRLIREKDKDLKGRMETQGTTPRQLTDLLGSLSDLTSGSGDKGTPVVLIQNYFSNYSDQ